MAWRRDFKPRWWVALPSNVVGPKRCSGPGALGISAQHERPLPCLILVISESRCGLDRAGVGPKLEDKGRARESQEALAERR